MSMRKLFWSCAVGAVAAAAGVYAAANHACHEPDSTVGQVMIGVYRGVLQNNPVYAMAQAISSNGCPMCAEQPAAPQCAAVEVRVASDSALCETVDLRQCRLPGRIVINEEEAWPVVGAVVELIPAPRMDESTAIGGTEESEDTERLMPPAEDTAPAVMPPADGELTVGDDLFGFWQRLLPTWRQTGIISSPAQEEQSEAPNYGRPPDCREDPHHYQQYPGCPHMGCPQRQMYCPYTSKPMGVVPASRPEPAEPKPEQLSVRPRALQGGAEESEVRQSRYRGVDTMEFRPTDAKPSEFGLMPF